MLCFALLAVGFAMTVPSLGFATPVSAQCRSNRRWVLGQGLDSRCVIWYTDILFCKALWGASARARHGGFMWDIAITKKKSIYICVYVYIYTYINIYTEIYMGLRFPRCHDANGKSSMSFVFDALSEIPQAAGTMKNVYLAKSNSDM